MNRTRINLELLSRNSQFFKSFKNKRLLNKLRKQIQNYSETFSQTLYSHLTSEFEVNVRAGKIIPEGYATLDKLQEDFIILQYQDNLDAIFRRHKLFCNSIVAESLLDVVKEEVFNSFLQLIKDVQDLVSKERKLLNNKMCRKKIQEGPVVHNFTTKDIPSNLMTHLISGLNNVPYLNIDQNSLVSGIEEEAINACKNAFVSIMGFYPARTSDTNLNQAIIKLLTQAPSNSILVNNLITFREHYVDGLGQYLQDICDTGINLSDILELIPQNCIISQSDKNIGISMLPPSWYAKEYQSQILKGGYEEVSMSEDQCLMKLNKLIYDFQKNNSVNQCKILSKFWPKNVPTKFRLGVLKLVPKVRISSC